MVGDSPGRAASLPITRTLLPFGPEKWGAGEQAWRSLQVKVPTASAFLAADWIDAWREAYAATLGAQQLVCTNELGEPVGTVLLVTTELRRFGVRWRRLFINTDGEPGYDSAAIEQNGLLALPGREREVAEAVAAYATDSGIDEILLSGATAETVALCRSVLSEWKADLEWRTAPYVDLAALRARGTMHLSCVSANTRAQLRRTLRGYGGKVVVQLAEHPTEAHAWFAELVALHRARWHRRGQAGAFASPRRSRLIEGYIDRAAGNGGVHVLRIAREEETIGVLLNFHANGRIAFYQSGFAYPDDNRLKPGMLAHHLAIEYYRERGFVEYDFLTSGPGEGRYKSSLAIQARQLGWLSLVRPGVRAAVVHAVRLARLAVQRPAVSAGSIGAGGD